MKGMWKSLGYRFRALRRKLGLRQVDLAARTGLSRETISRLERGLADQMVFATAGRIAHALGARLIISLSWQGEQLDRLIDAGHAELQNATAALLTAAGWLCAVEVSFNHYGDRGRYDILAFHPATGILLVVEIKTAIGNVQATLGQLDVKVRMGTLVARERGWRPRAVVSMLVIADARQQQRIVAAHASLFARFSLRGQKARGWLRHPAPDATGLLVYLPPGRRRGPGQASRVRRPASGPPHLTDSHGKPR